LVRVLDSLNLVGTFTSLALTSDNAPVISYYYATGGDLKLAICASAACESVRLISLDTFGNVGLFTSLKLGPDNAPVVSYYASTLGDLKLARCTDATCSRLFLFRTLFK
jgi:hypothetical protein